MSKNCRFSKKVHPLMKTLPKALRTQGIESLSSFEPIPNMTAWLRDRLRLIGLGSEKSIYWERTVFEFCVDIFVFLAKTFSICSECSGTGFVSNNFVFLAKTYGICAECSAVGFVWNNLYFWPKLLVFVPSAVERDLFRIILYFWPKLLVFVQSAVRWDWKDELAAICPDSLSVSAAS